MNIITQTVQVFDPAMCCSTGVCGPDIDPKIVQFASDLDWIKSQGLIVQRHNLAQNAAVFAENAEVKTALTDKGESALPIMLVNGKIAFSGRYPERTEIAEALGLKADDARANSTDSDCCSDGGCC